MREEERISLLGNEEITPKSEYLRNSKIIKTLLFLFCLQCRIKYQKKQLKDLKMAASGKTDYVG